MPIRNGKDKQGPYFQWGNHGQKYHYKPGHKPSRERARNQALKQAQAAFSNGYKGK